MYVEGRCPAASCLVSPYAQALECREPAGSSPAIPYSDCRLFVDHQEKKIKP